MKNLTQCLFVTLLLMTTGAMSAVASDGNGWTINYGPSKSFIENKGQFKMASEKNAETSAVKYAYDDGTTMIYFTPAGVTYSLVKRWKNSEDENPKEMAEERLREEKEIREGKPHSAIEAEEHHMNFKTDVVNMVWENANPNVELISEDLTSDRHSYVIKGKNGDDENINNIRAYKKLLYKNIYPNIDIEFSFHPETGIKYALILHPGADASLVKMKYSGDLKISDNGDVHIATKFGDIIDHAPVTFYSGNNSSLVNSHFIKNGKTVSFALGDYDHSRSLTVDPWTQTPTLSASNGVWECEKDAAGNAYIIGGDSPMKLLKYNAAGALQWTYNTPWDTANFWLGTLATDNAGNSYVTAGSPAKLQKVTTAGAMVYSVSGGGNDEYWTISFNCDQTKLIIGGTRLVIGLPTITGSGVIFDINAATGAVSSIKTVGWVRAGLFGSTDAEEVRALSSSFNSRYYYMTLDTVGFIDQNFSACPTTALTRINHGYHLGYKSENYLSNNGNGGIKSIRANKNFFYTQNGTTIQKRNLATCAVISSAAIPGGISIASFGFNQVGNCGIDIDSCGNVYVGSGNAVIKYDANLILLSSVSTLFRVYDVAVSTGGNVIACGATLDNSASSRVGYVQQINMSACNPMTLICCNTNFCQVGPFCVTASPVTLTPDQAGGTWSGTGVSSSGVFSPSVAGVGTFTITYSMACGSTSIDIVVNSCSALSVCQNPGPTFTVSGGTGPYNWQTQTTTTPCIPGAGFCSTFGTIAGPPVTTWTTYATGTTVTPAGTYPQQVVDNSGTVFSITSLASIPPCSGCPTLTVNITGQVNVACFGGATGSFNASTTGGATPWDYTLMNGATTVATFTNIAGTQAFSGLAAGTYTLNVLDNNGCPGTTTITITQPAAATTTAAAGPDQTVCGTTATLAGNTATVGTGTWTLVSGAGTITTPSSPTSGITALGVGANVFQWTITNAPCPSNNDQVTITGVAAPTTSNAGPNQSICATTATLAGNAATVGTGTWTLVSGAGTITTPSSPTSGVTGLGAGANVFQWTITNSPCPPSSSTVTITNTGGPTTSSAGPTQTVCGTTATLAGNTPTTGTGAWTLVSGSGTITSSTSPTSGVTALGVGANVFMWTISSAPCTPSTDTVTIFGIAPPTVSNAGPNQSGCSSSATLAGNTATVGTGTWTLVSGVGTITTPSSPTSGVTGLGTGANVFQWTITNSPCPSSSSTVTITNTGGPTTSAAGPTQTVCGTTATLAGNTPTTGTGAWTLASGSGTITSATSPTSGVTSLGVGANVFMWTISSAPCTPSTDTVTVFGIAPPTVSNAGPNQSGCSSSATLAGNAPAIGTGAWTLVSGSGTITTPASPTSGVTGLGTGANVFQWTITNSPCPASSSTVTITNTGGTVVNITGQNNVLCFGGSTGDATALQGSGVSPYDYVWNNAAGVIHTDNNITTASTATGLAAGTYTVTLTDSLGCSSTQTVTITQPATPAAVVITGSTNAPCGSSTGSATAQASGGSSPYDYVWTGTSGVLLTTNDITTPNTLSGLTAGTYTITITDNNGCTASTAIVINNTGGAIVSITAQTNVLCFGGTTGNATANSTGGSAPYDYVWTGSAGTLQTTLDISVPNTLSGLAAGTYTVTVTDNSGCVSDTTVTIMQPATAVSVASTSVTNASCGSSNGAATVAATGGTAGAGYTYSWAPSGGSAATATSLAANTYTITATDGNGCTAITTVVITNSGGPTVIIPTQTNVNCFGGTDGSATASATGGGGTYTYSWSGGGGTAATAAGLAAGTYTVTVSDGSCSNTATVIITQPATVAGTVTTTPAVCTSSTGTATIVASSGTAPYTYVWSTTETVSSIDSLAPGTYSVVITDANGCTQTSSGTIGTTGGVMATVSPDITITLGENTQLGATGGGTYSWSPATGLSCTNCANPVATPTQSTTYCVSVDSSTCLDTACVRVFVEIPCPTNTDLAVPNAFSPNNDGHNDNFCLQGWNICITEFTIYIYDRWGEKVFESTDASFCWDGTYKGKQLDPAVFVYYIKATFANDNKIDKKGNISIIR